jgi:hypothetical protein
MLIPTICNKVIRQHKQAALTFVIRDW